MPVLLHVTEKSEYLLETEFCELQSAYRPAGILGDEREK
jgi:hypothetical protein